VPGALANHPPAPATAPIVIPPVPGGPAAEGAPGAAPMVPINTRKDSTTNFELDKTVQHVRQPTGQIRRLSVAVLVAQKIKTDDKGNATPVALTDAELKRINDLTREAMGFNEARGDTLNVASAPFTEVRQDFIETPIWKDPELTGIAGDLLKYLLVAGVAAYLLFGVLKPLVRSLTEPVERDEDDVRDVTLDADGKPVALSGSAAAQLELSPEARAALEFETKLEAARTMARSDPQAIAEVIKHWVNGDE